MKIRGGKASHLKLKNLNSEEFMHLKRKEYDILTRGKNADKLHKHDFPLSVGGGGSGTDEKAKVSENDTDAGFLNGKLVAGSDISFTENNDGGNETLEIDLNPTTSSKIDVAYAERGTPKQLRFTAVGQSAGNLNLVEDDTNWDKQKMYLTELSVEIASGSCSDFDVELYEKDSFDSTYLRWSNPLRGNTAIGVSSLLGIVYEDQDATKEVHLKIVDNDGSGSPTFDVEVFGYEMR